MKLTYGEWKFRVSESYRTQPGPAVKNGTPSAPAGDQTRDPANLVRRSAMWATKALARLYTHLVILSMNVILLFLDFWNEHKLYYLKF